MKFSVRYDDEVHEVVHNYPAGAAEVAADYFYDDDPEWGKDGFDLEVTDEAGNVTEFHIEVDFEPIFSAILKD